MSFIDDKQLSAIMQRLLNQQNYWCTSAEWVISQYNCICSNMLFRHHIKQNLSQQILRLDMKFSNFVQQL